jgi:hypothetical protein
MSTLDVTEPPRGLSGAPPRGVGAGGDGLTPTARLELGPIAERHAAEIGSLSA